MLVQTVLYKMISSSEPAGGRVRICIVPHVTSHRFSSNRCLTVS